MTAIQEAQQILEPTEQARLLNVIGALIHIHTPAQFQRWTQTGLQSILPHGMLMCGIGRTNGPRVQIINHISVNFPLAYIEEIKRPDGGVLSPIMERWLKENKPQLFDPAQSMRGSNPRWMAIFNRYGLRNIAAHGMNCISEPVFSYFSFSRIPEQLGPRHAHLLEHLAPHMHLALARVLLHKGSPQGHLLPKQAAGLAPVALTPREKEVLHWLREGKTNWEIGRILTVGDETVKSHVQKVLVKLKVNNRAQAVAKAMTLNILQS